MNLEITICLPNTSASVPDTLAALHVSPDTGLANAEVDVRRKEHGYNEVLWGQMRRESSMPWGYRVAHRIG